MAWAEQLEHLIAPTPDDLDFTPIADAVDRMSRAHVQLGSEIKDLHAAAIADAIDRMTKAHMQTRAAAEQADRKTHDLLQAVLASLKRLEEPREIVRNVDGLAIGTKITATA
jgi:hypothetical protein